MTQDEVEVVSRGLITKQAQAFTIYPRVNGKPLDKLFRKLTHFFIVNNGPKRQKRQRPHGRAIVVKVIDNGNSY